MQIIRWSDPFTGLSNMHQQVDDLFNQLVSSGSSPGAAALTSAMDIYNEDDKNLVVEVSAPGFSKEDIELSLHQGILEIKGEKTTKEESKDQKRNYMMRESSSSFYRRVALPKNVDSQQVSAEFDNGTLKISLPYKELPSPVKVQINERASSGKNSSSASKPSKK